MSTFSRAQVEQALRAWRDPHLDQDLLLSGALRDIAIDGTAAIRDAIDARLSRGGGEGQAVQ